MKTKEEELKKRLEEVLDEQFPKGECKERGHALVLFAEAVFCIDKQKSLALKEVREKIKRGNKYYEDYVKKNKYGMLIYIEDLKELLSQLDKNEVKE